MAGVGSARDVARRAALTCRRAWHARERNHLVWRERNSKSPVSTATRWACIGSCLPRTGAAALRMTVAPAATRLSPPWIALQSAPSSRLATRRSPLSAASAAGRDLLDPSVPLHAPRIVASADTKLIDALLGPCRLQSGLGMDLRHKPNALTIQANSPNGYDSNFCPLHSTHCCGSRKADGTASEQRLASSR